MNATQRANLIAANKYHAGEVARLQALIRKISDGAASASISSGGGSKSYTNHDIPKLRAEIREHQSAISRNQARMAGGGVGRHVYTTRGGRS